VGLDFVAVPNPFRGQADLHLAVEQAGPVHLQVFDAHGRRVRDLRSVADGGGDIVVTWDGKDAAGHDVEAGVYLVRARVPNGTVRTTSVIRMK
ncbi:MAG: T9SS type A sorting domain-containing protein, partial [Candidatus Eisenbacteria bacterium]|nr:T9SS type A sorting domain-containing protein [Candidatus Eisenbacteria bacterium]